MAQESEKKNTEFLDNAYKRAHPKDLNCASCHKDIYGQEEHYRLARCIHMYCFSCFTELEVHKTEQCPCGQSVRADDVFFYKEVDGKWQYVQAKLPPFPVREKVVEFLWDKSPTTPKTPPPS